MTKPIATRHQPTWRIETKELIEATGASSGKTCPVDKDGGVLVANRYINQVCVVLSGTLKGTVLNVVSNTTTVLTFEEDVGTSIANNDRMSITTWGQPPGSTPDASGNVNDLFGQMLDASLPSMAREYFSGRYHGSNNMPSVEEFIPMKNDYSASPKLIVKSAAFFALAFGKISESTADYAGGDPNQALTSTALPGDRVVACVSTSFTIGDLVHITGGTNGVDEVGIIESKPDAASIKLVHPLKNFHYTDGRVHEILCTTPGTPDTVITKTLTIDHWVPTFTFESGVRREHRWTGTDIVMQFMGLTVEKFGIRSSPGTEPMSVEMDIKGLHWRFQTAGGVDLSSVSAKTEVGFDKGAYLPMACTGTINSVNYPEDMDFSLDMSRMVEPTQFHTTGDIPYYVKGDPISHYYGAVDISAELSLPLKNRNFLTLIRAGTEFGLERTYKRTGTGDQMKITLTGCSIKGPIMDSIPEEGMIPQKLALNVETATIEIKDLIPYYVM